MRLILACAVLVSASVSFGSDFKKNDEGNDVKVVSQSVSKMTPASLKLLKKNLSCNDAKDRGGRPIAIIQVENLGAIAEAASPSMKTAVNQLYSYASNCKQVRAALKNPKALSLEQLATIEKATHVVPEGVPAEGTYCKIRNIEQVSLQSNGQTVENVTGYLTKDLMDWTKGSCDQF